MRDFRAGEVIRTSASEVFEMIYSTAQGVDEETAVLNPVPKAEHNPALPLLTSPRWASSLANIGTSPLYTMKTVLSATGQHVHRATTLGVVSLLV